MTDQSRPTVASAYLRALKDNGVDWIFGNAGTDFAPLIEALATMDPDEAPRPVEILHETVAVAMAHGYFLMSGRPQCAMVHVNVGLANAAMGLINAARARVPLLLASGRTPLTEQGRLGSRDVPIHWGQEMFDQGGMVREFVKWDNELRAGEQVVAQVGRALAIAQAEPKGPTYLSLPREVLAEPLPDRASAGPGHRPPTIGVPAPPHPDPEAIATAAEALAGADHPLIITSDGGPELFSVLGPFVERHAIPVVQFWRTTAAITTDHAFYAGESPAGLIERSDVVLVLDSLVPWMPAATRLRDDAMIIQVGPDPMFAAVPVRHFPTDLAITSTAAAAVAALDQRMRDDGAETSGPVTGRRAGLVAELAERRASGRRSGLGATGSMISPAHLTRTLSDVMAAEGPGRATVVNELGLAPGHYEIDDALGFLGLPFSGGLGWAGGAAVGAKLATPDRTVVWATGDGSYVFSNAMAVHHAASSLGLGLVTVIADNRVWNAVRRSAIAVYPEGAAAAADHMAFTSLEPAPDYTKIAEAYGAAGRSVDDPAELRGALEEAVEIGRSGRQAVVAVRVSHPDTAIN